MKITSKPAGTPIGIGDNLVHLTDDQLDLIMALVCQCRLGAGSPYSVAAFELCSLFSEEYGDELAKAASMAVDFTISVEDDDGNTIFESIDGYYPMIDV